MGELLSDPISRIYAVMSLLVVVASAVIGFNFNRDYTTNELAHEAILLATNARPYPYTSQMADSYKLQHAETHRSGIEQERMLNTAKLAAKEAQLRQTITETRPPGKVENRMIIIERSVHRLDLALKDLASALAIETARHDK